MCDISIHNQDCMELFKAIPDKSIDHIVTDPPYLLQKAGGGAFGIKHRTYHSEYLTMSDGISENVLKELIRVMKKVNLYLWGNWKLICKYLAFFEKEGGGIYMTSLLTWHKTNPIPSCGNKYLNDTEYCLYVREKGVKLYGGYHDHKSYWITSLNTKDKAKYNHPTIKPYEIIKQMIMNSSLEGETVMDPYLGSGTTAKVCKDSNRNFIGSEIDPNHYQTALNRLNEVE